MSIKLKELETALKAAFPEPLNPKVSPTILGGGVISRTDLVVSDQYSLDTLTLEAFNEGMEHDMARVLADRTAKQYLDAFIELAEKMENHLYPDGRKRGRHAA